METPSIAQAAVVLIPAVGKKKPGTSAFGNVFAPSNMEDASGTKKKDAPKE